MATIHCVILSYTVLVQKEKFCMAPIQCHCCFHSAVAEGQESFLCFYNILVDVKSLLLRGSIAITAPTSKRFLDSVPKAVHQRFHLAWPRCSLVAVYTEGQDFSMAPV